MKATSTTQVKLDQGELDTELTEGDETLAIGLCLIFREYLF